MTVPWKKQPRKTLRWVRKTLRWVSITALLVAVPLIVTGNEFGWKLAIIGLGVIATFSDLGDWEPYKFPTREERKAAEAAKQLL